MTDTEKLKELLAAATPGKWRWSHEFGDYGGRYIAIESTADWQTVAGESGPGENDAALIVAAVNALPALLAEVEGLRAENWRLLRKLERHEGILP